MILQIGKDDWGIKQYGEIKKNQHKLVFLYIETFAREGRERKKR